MIGFYFIFAIIFLALIIKEVFLNKNQTINDRTIPYNSKLGHVIYNHPIISALALNITSTAISIYLIKNELSYLFCLLIFAGIGNRKILDNGINLTKSKKIIIFVSFL